MNITIKLSQEDWLVTFICRIKIFRNTSAFS